MKEQIHPRRAGMPITATARNTNHATSAISCTTGTVLAARFLSSRFERTDGGLCAARYFSATHPPEGGPFLFAANFYPIEGGLAGGPADQQLFARQTSHAPQAVSWLHRVF